MKKGGEGLIKGKTILVAPGLPASTPPEEPKSVVKLNDSSIYSRVGQQAPIKQKNPIGGARGGRGGAATPPPINRGSNTSANSGRQRFKALYDYEAQNPDELSMNTGDIIELIEKEDEAWFKGELNGQRGIFPAQYCEEVKGSAPGPPRPSPPRGGASPRGGSSPTAPARGGASPTRGGVSNRGGSSPTAPPAPAPPGPPGRGAAPPPPGGARGGFPARGAPTRGGRGY